MAPFAACWFLGGSCYGNPVGEVLQFRMGHLAFPHRGAGPDVPTDIATPQEMAVQFYRNALVGIGSIRWMLITSFVEYL